MSDHQILQPSGGYRRLRSFILAQLISDKMQQSVVATLLVIPLIEQVTYLPPRQIARQADDFKEHGGFTERLYHVTSNTKKAADLPQ